MKTRRILSMLLALVMVLSLVPTFAFAADGDTEGKLFLDKTATLEPDGSYTINMSAYATGTTTTTTIEKGVPLDIVLVIDQSGSMAYDLGNSTRLQALKDAVSGFVTAVYEDGKTNKVNHRIAMVGFASNETDEYSWWGGNNPYNNTGIFNENGEFVKYNKNPNYKAALVPVANENGSMRPSLNTAIQNFKADGATRASLGVKMANQIFKANPLDENPEHRERIMIVFTDGEPGQSGYESTEANATIQNAEDSKNTYGATVYTVGLFSGDPTDQVNDFMWKLSSNHYAPVSGEPDTAKSYYINRGTEGSPRWFTVNYGTVDVVTGFIDNDKFKDKPETQSKTCWYFNDYYDYQEWHEGRRYGKWTNVRKQFNFEVTNGSSVNPDLLNCVSPFYELHDQYYKTASTADELNAIFKTISEESTSTNTSVKLTKDSILRDIMAEGFQMTENSTVTVQVVPGTATKNVQVPEDISWKNDEAKTVLTMTLTDSSKTAEGLTASMSETQVDVTGFDYQTKYIAPQNSGSKLVVKITGVKALPTVTTDQNIYTNAENSGIYNGTDSLEPAAKFPHVPETHMTSKSYVVDYAKPLDLAIADFKLNTAKNIDKDGYNPFNPANTAITHKYGDVKLENNALTYTPKTMQWDGFDTFYVFGTTADETVKAASANANGNVWGKVNVIPANNVYYEDTFVTNNSTGTVGITYTGEWTEVGNNGNVTTAPEDSSNANDNQGWIPVLNGENGDTDGSSHHTVASKDNVAKATFTFTGTGVDVYSHTSPKTGTISVKLAGADGNTILRTAIDTLSASGDYYQIPTLSLHEDLKGEALPYGTYTVTITVSTAAEGRYEYYLDGIRVYNPIAEDETVKGAYGDEELNATFMEVRDLLLDQNDLPEGQNAIGPVFIDKDQNEAIGTESPVVGVYKDYGPKNEVYLSSGQSISFKVDTTQGNLFQIGLKSPSGAAAAAKIGNKNALQEVTVNHTADLYYTVTPDADGFITVTNTGDALLSITKLKITNPSTTVNTAAVFAEAPVPMLLTATQEFNAANASQPDVDIENPDVPEETPENPGIWDILDKIFGGIGGWFHP